MSTNHPNRNGPGPTRWPTGAEIAAGRIAAGLSYAECAALVHERPRRWAAFEQDEARMHPAAWELFRLKTATTGRNPPPYTPPFHEFPRARRGELYELSPDVLAQLKTADSAGLRQRLHAFVTPAAADGAPRAGETWYDRDTGCAVRIIEVVEGIVRACGTSAMALPVHVLLRDWSDSFQREPVVV